MRVSEVVALTFIIGCPITVFSVRAVSHFMSASLRHSRPAVSGVDPRAHLDRGPDLRIPAARFGALEAEISNLQSEVSDLRAQIAVIRRDNVRLVESLARQDIFVALDPGEDR